MTDLKHMTRKLKLKYSELVLNCIFGTGFLINAAFFWEQTYVALINSLLGAAVMLMAYVRFKYT